MKFADQVIVANAMLNMKSPKEVFPEYYLIRVNAFDKIAENHLEEWIEYLKEGVIAEDTTVDWDKLYKGKNGKDASVKKLHSPKPWQNDALEKAHEYYQTHDRGKLIMACGTGKTFTSLRLVEQETANKGLILVMVPSIALINQTLNEWTNQSQKDISAICVCSDSTASKRKSDNLDDLIETSEDLAMPACTDARSVARQIYEACQDSDGMVVVFSTYQSIDVISLAQKILMGTAPKDELALFDEDYEIKPGDYSFDFIIYL